MYCTCVDNDYFSPCTEYVGIGSNKQSVERHSLPGEIFRKPYNIEDMLMKSLGNAIVWILGGIGFISLWLVSILFEVIEFIIGIAIVLLLIKWIF